MNEKSKIKIELGKKKDSTIDYNGFVIEVRNMIGLSTSGVIISKAFSEMNLREDELISGEVLLGIYAYFDLFVLEACTNIDMKEVDYEEFVGSGLLKDITDIIIDYNSYKDILGIAILDYNNNLNQEVLTRNIGDVFMRSIPNPENMEEYTRGLMTELKDMNEDDSLTRLSNLISQEEIKKNGKEILKEEKEKNKEVNKKKEKMN